MQYNVKWIINGSITIAAESKEKAEEKIKQTLENIIKENKDDFENVGAAAIQGSANKINNE
jgi:chorismate mutase|tara:strand:- start:71 stop:253 length:183 start_codon:yes stop_codon:yes gene_type:complete